jgi:hypothetical protein
MLLIWGSKCEFSCSWWRLVIWSVVYFSAPTYGQHSAESRERHHHVDNLTQ